jgi:hypothetical protein
MTGERRSVLVLCAALLAACGGGGGGSSDNPPPLPAAVQISKTPNQTLYGLGDTIEISTLVLDAAGKTMPNVTVTLASVPPASQQNGNQFVYQNDGTYTISATVQGATQGGLPVTASTDAVVDGHGPTIACASPIDGGILNQTAGTQVNVSGSVDDVHGVSAFSVNGTNVAVGAGGAFTAPVTSVWGINFVDLAATDGTGLQARRTCAFLLSDSFAAEGALLSDAISVRMTQLAVDDNNAAALNSLADFLRVVVNSSGLPGSVDTALLAANPLKPSSCDLPIPPFGCAVTSEITYLDLQMLGPKTSALLLVSGGMGSTSNLGPVTPRLEVTGNVLTIPFDTTGTVNIASVAKSLTFDTALSGGRPRVSVRPGSAPPQVGAITPNFSGLDGAVMGAVTTLANGTVRNIVADTLQSFITNNLNSTLDGIVSSLDVRTLGTSFAVARLDGTGTLTVNFDIGFSSLSTTASRMLTGVSTRFTATAAQARPSFGAPLPPGTRLLDPVSATAMQIALYPGLHDQALHALWRAGYFDASFAGGALGGLVPAGAAIALVPNLPPAVTLRNDGRLEITLGAVNLHVDYLALLGTPVDGSLGGRVSCVPNLIGQALALVNCAVDELHVSTGEIVPDAQTQAALEDLLRPILLSILSTAAKSLPALPLPNYRTPASVATFGLPANANLGLIGPFMSTSSGHLLLSGGFGLQ